MDFQLVARNLLNKIFVGYANDRPRSIQFIEFIDSETVRKTYSGYYFNFLNMTCHYLMENPHPLLVPIKDFKKLNNGKYSYDMKKLLPISDAEEDIVNSAHRNYGTNIISRWRYGKLLSFLDKVMTDNMYWDLHGGNVMVDSEGNYRLIDLEGLNKNSRFAELVKDWAKANPHKI